MAGGRGEQAGTKGLWFVPLGDILPHDYPLRISTLKVQSSLCPSSPQSLKYYWNTVKSIWGVLKTGDTEIWEWYEKV